MVAAPSKCPPGAAPLVAWSPRPRRLRCRCCEDTLGAPRRRSLQQQQQQFPAPELLRLHNQQPFPELQAAAIPSPNQLQAALPYPRPRRIVLVRHGECEGNVDEAAYTRVPAPRIGLIPQGWADAQDCGRRLRRLFSNDGKEDDWKVYFYVSPYRRTLETLRGISPAFEPHHIAGVREEPRLREQDFGNFQDREQMQVEKELRRRYGRFFYRFPNGESAADVYDRITGFRETLRADIEIGRFEPPGPHSANMNVVLVGHGVTLRVFLMRWYQWTVRQFEGLSNLPNGGALVMQTGDGGRYSLLVHHTADELRAFGLTEEMLEDQMWQKTAKPGDINYKFMANRDNAGI